MPERCVVVVEDDPLLRSDAIAMLDAAGLDVAGVETADEALAFIERRAGAVSAVLTDVQVPTSRCASRSPGPRCWCW